jgi:hypothetical protein
MIAFSPLPVEKMTVDFLAATDLVMARGRALYTYQIMYAL